MNCSIIREFETATETHVLIGSMERQYWKADSRRQKENCKAKERKAKNEHKRSLGSVRQCDNKQFEEFEMEKFLYFQKLSQFSRTRFDILHETAKQTALKSKKNAQRVRRKKTEILFDCTRNWCKPIRKYFPKLI